MVARLVTERGILRRRYSLSNRRTERNGISEIKFEAVQIHFLNDIFVLVALSRERGVELRHVVYES